MGVFPLFAPDPLPNSDVVDRAARDDAVIMLRRFANGQITSDFFQDEAPVTADAAVHAIWDTAWLYYDDLKEHKLIGRHRLHSDAKRAWMRWMIFLDTDLLYEWPPIRHPGNQPCVSGREGMIGWVRGLFGVQARQSNAEGFMAAGHYPVWPFIKASDYKTALATPRRLAAKKSK